MSIFKYLAQSTLSFNAVKTWLYIYDLVDGIIPMEETLSFIYSECATDLKIPETEILRVLEELEHDNLIQIHTLNFPFPDSLELILILD